jgi:hypothetical protein
MPITIEKLKIARDSLIKAGFSPDEADVILEPDINELAGKKPSVFERSTGELGLAGAQQVAAIAAPFLAGSVASGLGARLAANPKVASAVEAIGAGARGKIGRAAGRIARFGAERGVEAAQPILEGAGIAAGDVAGRAIAGQPQDPTTSALTGVGGATIGTLARGLIRGAGAVANVPSIATREVGVPTGGIIPAYGKVIRPLPRTAGQASAGISSESRLVPRFESAVARLRNTATPMRQQKLKLIAEAEVTGARIDPEPIIDILLGKVAKLRMEPSTKGPFTAYLDDFANNIVDEAAKRGGTFSPLEWDEFIRTNLAPKAYTMAGDPVSTRIGPIIREVKNEAAKLLRNTLPEKSRGLDAQISQFLGKVEDAEGWFGGDRAGIINRIRTLRRPGNEDKIAAMNFLSQNADKGLAKATMKLATQRLFTTDIREPFGEATGAFGTLFKTPLEAAVQVTAPLQPFIGPAAAAVAGPRPAQYLSEQTEAFLRSLGLEEPAPPPYVGPNP